MPARIKVLQDVPLNIAFLLMSLTYVLMVVGNAKILQEPVNQRQVLGVLLLTIGLDTRRCDEYLNILRYAV